MFKFSNTAKASFSISLSSYSSEHCFSTRACSGLEQCPDDIFFLDILEDGCSFLSSLYLIVNARF
jgi:hypothetical protein